MKRLEKELGWSANTEEFINNMQKRLNDITPVDTYIDMVRRRNAAMAIRDTIINGAIIAVGRRKSDPIKNADKTTALFNDIGDLWKVSVNGMLGKQHESKTQEYPHENKNTSLTQFAYGWKDYDEFKKYREIRRLYSK